MSNEIRVRETPPDPDRARAEIENTRARMSETIDEIEGVLVRKKARIQDRMDVLAVAREKPMQSIAIALGAGILAGLITGGGGNNHSLEDEHDTSEGDLWEQRAAEWENRARRLLRIAQEQEQDLNFMYHQSSNGAARDDREGRLGRLRDGVLENVGGYVSSALRQLTDR
ncbi:MAG TPA: DUF3618 domain-containing protein [Longimicrobiaceae bacterium]|nr:DUF3618 domain-containing protein [Longimicrobiaceae bacterium]